MKLFYKLLFLLLLVPILSYSFPDDLPDYFMNFKNRTDKHFLDSLYNEAKTTTYDTVKAIDYIRICIALDFSSKTFYKDKSGADYFVMAKDIAIKHNKQDVFLQAIDNIGVRNRRNGKFKTALRFHMAALDMVDSLKQPQTKSIILNNIGVVYRRIDNFQSALLYHMKALKIADSLDDSRTKAIAINSIGNIYMSLEKYDEALNYFRQSLAIEYKRKNNLGLAINLNNIGSVYQAKGSLDSAYSYYMQSMNINKQINSEKGIAICHADIGDIYFDKKEYRNALSQYKTAEDIFKKTNDKIYLANSYLKEGKVLVTIDRPVEGEESLKKALAISLKIGSKVISEKAYRWLAKAYKKQEKYKLALESFEMSNNLQDSINNIAIQKNIIRMQIQYDLENKETEIALLQQQQQINKLELKKQRAANLLMLVILIFILLGTLLLAYFIFTRNQKNKLLQEKNQEIEKAQKALEKYSQDLLKAKKEADRSNRAKSEFLANISHEFRTPLNSVIGFTDLMLSNEQDTEKCDRLSIIKSSSKSLLVLLNDILDLSKIEAGKLEITCQPVEVVKTIEEIYKLFKINTDKKGIIFNKTIQKEFPEKVVFSEIRLRQILFNVIGNAVKYTDEGKIDITAEFTEAENPDKINFCITITDTGRGISNQDIERIFKPFVQLADSSNQQGTGLGLTITKRLIESMGGKLEVQSTVGIGTTFCVRFFNIKIVTQKNTQEREEQTSNIYLSNSYKAIIFATDKESCKKEYETLLEKNNISFTTFINELDKAKPVINTMDLAILCGNSPELLKKSYLELANVPHKKSLRFVVITNYKAFEQYLTNQNHYVVNRHQPKSIDALLQKLIAELKASNDKLMECINNLHNNQDFIDEFNNSLLPVFNLAWETRLMGNIKKFSSTLKSISKNYDITSLNEFSKSLDRSVQNFNINEVEKMLLYFKNYCITSQLK